MHDKWYETNGLASILSPQMLGEIVPGRKKNTRKQPNEKGLSIFLNLGIFCLSSEANKNPRCSQLSIHLFLLLSRKINVFSV